MIGEQHTDHIANGQRVSRLSLPTLQFFIFFAYPHFLKTIIANRTNGTFGIARHPDSYRDRPFAKPKEPFFANAPTIIRILQ